MEAFQYPYKVHKISCQNNIDIAYIDEGNADQTLLFIHGMGSYIPAWNKNIEELKTTYRCIAIDLPNYGKSSKRDYEFTMSFFTNIIEEFIALLGLKKASIIGHSMGGLIAFKTALTENHSVNKLILLAPAGIELFTEKEAQWFYDSITSDSLERLTDKQIKINFEFNFHDGRLPEDALFMYEDRLMMKADKLEYRYFNNMLPRCIKGMLQDPILLDLSKTSIPILIIFGRQDKLIPNRTMHENMSTDVLMDSIQKVNPSIKTKLLDQCGHFIQWEKSKEINKIIMEFIA